MQQITLTRPDDWHLHLRDGTVLADVVAHSASVFGRAIIMPNLQPPVTVTEQALDYRQRILDALPEGSNFEPLMTLYLTDRTTAEDIRDARASGLISAAKLYPAGATTNSDSGVTDIQRIIPALQAMADLGMPLLVHGEVTRPEIDIFDREAVFIEEILQPLHRRLPALKIVLEHITTEQAVAFVRDSNDRIAATITAHHLLYNRNDMLVGGIRPHLYCLPVLKRNRHQLALIEAATSGNPKFFLGTDSAPHARGDKESVCGCAGCYTALAALPLYAEAFEQAGALDRLEGFASHFGPAFYGLPQNRDQVTLIKEAWTVPTSCRFGDRELVPLRAGETVQWQVQENRESHV